MIKSNSARTAVPAPGVARRPPGSGRLLGLRRWLVPAAVVVAWQIASATGLADANAIPAPSTVLVTWWSWMFGERNQFAWYSGTWFEYVYLSTRRVLTGFAIAAALGVSLGLLIGWSRLARDLADPMIQILRPIPMTAWLPFATFVFGIQDPAAVFLIAMGAFFPIVVNSAAGAERTPRVLIRAALMLGTARHKLLYRVVLPSALPSIVTGLRLGLGIAWVLVIVAEMLAVKGGLGYSLWSAYQFIRMDLIVASMLSVGIFGFLFDLLLVAIARRAMRWSQGL